MAELYIEQPGLAPITLPVAGNTILLGRAEDNDAVLLADEVSRHHAKIECRAGRIVLIDLKSMNGTYVNRQRIVERVLSHQDDIWLGSKCHIVYRDPEGLGCVMAPRTPTQDSSIIQDLNLIRAEMDRIGNSMTMIGRRGLSDASTTRVIEVDTGKELLSMSRAYRRLAALYDASKLMASEFDLDRRLSEMLDKVMEVMEAERGFVLLRDDQAGRLTVKVARQMGHELHAGSPSMGIAEKAADKGEPVLMASRDQDDRFGGRASIIQQAITSAMCAPLKTEGRIIGSIYLDTSRPGAVFSNEDLELFTSLAAQSAMAIENVRLYEKMVTTEKRRANLGRFLSPAIVEQVMKHDTALQLGGDKHTVTTMFCDIRGFTQIAERLTPTELVMMLNQHFTAMTEIIFTYAGTLDKFIGDEIMAVFGAPIAAADDAERCVRAAMAIQAKNEDLNALRETGGQPTFEIGIGINTGETVAGYVGSPDRMEFTVVGDSVNVARRFCSIAGPGQVVVGETTYEIIKDKAEARPTGSVLLKGKSAPKHGYEILRMKS
ncbi:MAG TPA: adenylate/guanylate cyclase domain-containing protein [Candidatus Hydrogenedentes bacterium]|nr:adenylate/guanylate cyclase domain-containing protein [Candidatus Hydrogenedentota bacterium]HQE83430.1 adenylate/guanylate cyclase domain-containing protein [Candidatus Hydrogenedentota bacterium]HQH51103.1 adenylate/guanylate cyclase domain-containing protein [Candidatus Hydrogenedentota bacterium]HQM47398.1 adenylate/guanylate cyclase domain-containing protein [Candidatus Hydrogenedentota bacterium]